MEAVPTEPRPAKTHPREKNRAWGKNPPCQKFAYKIEPQALELHRENAPRSTKSASGVLYYGYRYYNAEMGRWLSRDPIGERGGYNLYAMVGNDGVNWIDLLGAIPVDSSGVQDATEAPYEIEDQNEKVAKVTGELLRGGRTRSRAGGIKPPPRISVEVKSLQSEDGTCWVVEAIVSIDQVMTFNSQQSGLTSDRVLGHEQRHVKSLSDAVHSKIVRPLEAVKEKPYTKQEDANVEVDKLNKKYKKIARKIEQRQRWAPHSGDKPGNGIKPLDGSPASGVGYTPLEGSTQPSPPTTRFRAQR